MALLAFSLFSTALMLFSRSLKDSTSDSHIVNIHLKYLIPAIKNINKQTKNMLKKTTLSYLANDP